MSRCIGSSDLFLANPLVKRRPAIPQVGRNQIDGKRRLRDRPPAINGWGCVALLKNTVSKHVLRTSTQQDTYFQVSSCYLLSTTFSTIEFPKKAPHSAAHPNCPAAFSLLVGCEQEELSKHQAHPIKKAHKFTKRGSAGNMPKFQVDQTIKYHGSIRTRAL